MTIFWILWALIVVLLVRAIRLEHRRYDIARVRGGVLDA